MTKSGRLDVLSGILLVALGGGAIYGSVVLGLGKPNQPEPGFFPFLAAAAIFGLACMLIFQGFWHRDEETAEPKPDETTSSPRAALITIVGMMVFIAILDVVGFVISTMMIAGLLLYVFQVRSILPYVVGVPIIAIGSYLLFHSALGLPLPVGPFGF